MHSGGHAEESADPTTATTIHKNRLQVFVPGQRESPKLELFCTQRCPFTSSSDPSPSDVLPKVPLGYTSNTQEGGRASRDLPAPKSATTNPAPWAQGDDPYPQHRPPLLMALLMPKCTAVASSRLLLDQLTSFLTGCHVTLSLFAQCFKRRRAGWAAGQSWMLT